VFVTIVITTIAISIGYKWLGGTSVPKWGDKAESIATGIATTGIVLFVAIAGVHAALSGRATVRKMILFILIGIVCTSIAAAFPIFGLGGFLFIYGVPGLITLCFRRLPRRPQNGPSAKR
jgi:hypothetical protein